jgi:hypothetical protein
MGLAPKKIFLKELLIRNRLQLRNHWPNLMQGHPEEVLRQRGHGERGRVQAQVHRGQDPRTFEKNASTVKDQLLN